MTDLALQPWRLHSATIQLYPPDSAPFSDVLLRGIISIQVCADSNRLAKQWVEM